MFKVIFLLTVHTIATIAAFFGVPYLKCRNFAFFTILAMLLMEARRITAALLTLGASVPDYVVFLDRIYLPSIISLFWAFAFLSLAAKHLPDTKKRTAAFVRRIANKIYAE